MVDLKAWTREQIIGEAVRAYDRVWQQRTALGQHKVGALSQYLNANNYPEHIRGSLRSAASYLYVELLADSGLWRPEEANEQFRLDFEALLKGQAPRSTPGLDPAAHPLVKIGAILDDLEAWQTKEKRPEAALEARLERVRRLHAAFDQDDQKRALREHLAKLLPQYRSHAWWAMGQALLAQLWHGEDDVRAHGLAKEGASAYPDSVGGRACLSLQKQIEASEYGMEAMAADGPGKRSILINHRNLAAIHFRAWPLDLAQRLKAARDYRLLYDGEEIRKLVKTTSAPISWSVSLPATPDFKTHKTYVTPPQPLSKSGWYVIAASAKPDFSEASNVVTAVNFIVSDLTLVTHATETGATEVRVVSGKTGQPVTGAQVQLWRADWQSGHSIIDAKATDAEGLATFALRAGNAHFIVAQAKGEIALDPQHHYFQGRREPEETSAALVYTDRSIYRPTQKLLWKVVAYRGRRDAGAFKVAADAGLTVSLRDPNGQEVEKKSVKTNAYGSAAGEFVVPAGRPLGHWTVRISSTGNSLRGAAHVRVEEYKRPTFEVSFKDDSAPMRLNRAATLKGEARYYFGLPVTAGKVQWRVKRAPVFPWWWEWLRGGGDTNPQQIAAGTAPLGADGGFEVKFTPAADEKAGKEVSYRYEISADLTDEGGETRSAHKLVRLGFVAVDAQLSTETTFLRSGEAGSVTIRRTNLDGQARAGKGSFKLVALVQPNPRMPADEPVAAPREGDKPAAPRSYSTPGDALRPRWSHAEQPEAVLARFADGDARASGTTTHGADGKAEVKLPSLPPGVYRLRYQTVDDFGAKFETFKHVFVVGDKTPLALPAVLMVQSPSVRVGGTARIFAHSGFADQPIYFERYRAGKVIERKRVGEGRNGLIEIPVGEADRGGFGVALTTVRDHQFIRWTESVMVPWDNKELQVAFSTFRDKLRPGQKETWRVTIKGPAGAKLDQQAAEVLAYMYDRSLDLFGPHAPPSPLSLYPSRGDVTHARANLGAAPIEWVWAQPLSDVPAGPDLRGDELIEISGYGIGGMGGRRRGLGAPPPTPAMAPAADKARRLSEQDMSEERVEGRMAMSPAPGMAVTKQANSMMASRESADGAAAAAPTPAPTLRSNFSETAFFRPQLLLDQAGSVAIEFTVPDSVTAWNVWVHAITKDLRGGSTKVETKTVKDLMVRPYLPRFFREGDAAALKVVVNAAGDSNLSGRVSLDIVDPETQESRLALFGIKETSLAFSAEKGKSTNVTFSMTAPRAVGPYAFKVVANAGNLSDGELRPVPVLPSRMHLMQSRFVTLRDADKRVMKFDDLAKDDDATRINEQMVVSVDAQLFYTVLKALPYLVRYPYECTEQTLNRFVSTGIASSLYKQYPAIEKMAAALGKRQTQLETFAGADPNRKMALEETPFLVEAKGGAKDDADLINVLDSRIARANRDESLAKLRKAQTANGAFPWFPGGPPSPYMTLYIMNGFARAAEFGVDVPKDVVQAGWRYLAGYLREAKAAWTKRDCCWEFGTFLNYVASSYPDPSWVNDALTAAERKELLDFSFRHWKKHAPLLKGYLALTLARANRARDGKLVFASVMDAAKTERDQGTFWAPEDRSWLWYADTIETHAFALRVLTELDAKNAKKDGLVLWLLLNKKLNHWKSTRATAEVLYSLAHYLKAEGSLGAREEAKVAVGATTKTFEFPPDKYVGKAQIVVPGPKVGRETASVTVETQTKGFLFASATWHFSTDKLPTEDRGGFFAVSRKYFKRFNDGTKWVLQPLAEGASVEPGDEIEVQLSLRTKHAAEYVHLRDPRAAGLEPEAQVSKWKWDLGIAWYEEVRDSGANFFFEQLPVGEYTFKYRLRANMAGTFRVGPATVQSMYAPEFAAYSAGHVIKVR
ncbi:MAG TPA: alpha-2-macroglobulin family protein [Polyangia bacterium]